MMKQADKVAP